jgi:hypothetical protein
MTLREPSAVFTNRRNRQGVLPMRLTIELGPQVVQLLKSILGVETARQPPHRGPQNRATICEPSSPADTSHIQTQLEELKELVRTMRNPVIEKEFYSVEEVAERTQREGVTKYSKFTIRQACNLGRIPGAKKSHTGRNWRIPHETVRRILNEGLPPQSSHTSQVR